MNDLSYEIFFGDDSRVKDLEKIRINDNNSTYYLNLILEGKVLAIGCFYKEQLVGGAYVMNSFNALFIEHVFVKDEFQNNSLHIGSAIVNYILNNKDIFDKYFGVCFKMCRLESRNKDSFYTRLGFKKEQNFLETMKKRL